MNNKHTDSNEPAFAKPGFYHEEMGVSNSSDGLTKREYFAAMALQGILLRSQFQLEEITLDERKSITLAAVDFADDLIESLNY